MPAESWHSSAIQAPGTSTLVASVARELVATGLTATVIDLDPISSKLSRLLGAEPGDGLEALLSPAEVDPPATAETSSDREWVERICAPAAPGISLVAYGPAGPQIKRPEAAPLEMMLTQLANRAHVVLVAGIRDPAIELGVMRRADSRVLVFEPTLLSISAAACRLAMAGRGPSRPARAVLDENAALRAVGRPYPLRSGGAQPRRDRSLRAGAAWRVDREVRAPSAEGLPQGDQAGSGTGRAQLKGRRSRDACGRCCAIRRLARQCLPARFGFAAKKTI